MTTNILRRHLFRIDHHSENFSSESSDRKIISKLTVTFLLSSVMLLTERQAAQAQVAGGNLGNLGIPTASERFLDTGKQQLEREIQILQAPPSSTEVLQIHQEAQPQNDWLQLEDPRLHSRLHSRLHPQELSIPAATDE
jgi:hypothetical protein